MFDVLVLGAGAAGLMCAIEAAKRGRSVLVIDHAKAPGEKIRISGGGRCNFTNLHCTPKNFLSQNPHFCVSALRRFTPHDFIAMVERHGIAYHEKTLGQLFCDHSAKDIIAMLTGELAQAGGRLELKTAVLGVEKTLNGYVVDTNTGSLACESLVIATGGKSIPKMGATGIGYEIAQKFGLAIIEPRPALVPFTFSSGDAPKWEGMAGVALPSIALCGSGHFEEAMLVTHRGLSGPSILQISSFWREGESVTLDLLPHDDVPDLLRAARAGQPRAALHTILAQVLPTKMAGFLAARLDGQEPRMADLSNARIDEITAMIKAFQFKPGGTEGYRTAEVTLGGVDTDGLSSKTMAAHDHPNLFFIGEVVDVTGHLGGHNFQWAWSSGFAAGQFA